MSVSLSPAELMEVTGFKRASKQCIALASMGIPFKVRMNGTPMVPRSSLDLPGAGSSHSQPKAVVKAII